MSRIGKKVLNIPQNVEVKFANSNLVFKGPKGTREIDVVDSLEIIISENTMSIKNKEESRSSKEQHGLLRAFVANIIKGITVGFEKDLELVGVGYRVAAQGEDLVFTIGYSHPVKIIAPDGIKFVVEGQNKIKVVGINEQLVGQVAADIRSIREPDSYKGKGIKYAGEIIRRKQGKSVKK